MVALLGSPSALAVMVLEVAALVGAQVDCCDDVSELSPETTLVIALPDVHPPQEPRSSPWVRVGGAGDSVAATDILLPGQANVLAALLADPLAHVDHLPTGNPRGQRCLMVTGVKGGVGTSTAASRLARVAGALLLDASGHPPALMRTDVRPDALHWGLIDPADPPLPTDLLRHLPHIDGVRQLRALPGDALGVSDPRVTSVVARSPCPVVIDAGVWNRSLERVSAEIAGKSPIRSILISGGDEEGALRLAGVLAASGIGTPQLILGADKSLEACRQVAEHFDVPVATLPRNERQWRAVWQSMWSQ